MADKGDAEILACVVNGHDADKASVAAVNAINMYYGRGNVPIGAYQGSHGNPSHSPSTRPSCATNFHTRRRWTTSAPTALSVYRPALAAAPDGGVVIISVGFLMNLSDLVDSKADDVSPLAGLELVGKKVKRLVVMGGQFPNPKQFKEWNFSAGNVGIDAQHVVENWPTPILFSADLASARESAQGSAVGVNARRQSGAACLSTLQQRPQEWPLELGILRRVWPACAIRKNTGMSSPMAIARWKKAA